MPRPLFQYVGGKYPVVPEINRRFGAVDTRIDAFTGSSSWILASEPVRREVVNDLDGYVVNYLRAVKYAPEELARHLDFPRAELELLANHHYIRDKMPELVARLGGDPEYYDPVIAARWVYVLAYSIIYDDEPGGWLVRDGRLTYERGAGRKRASIATPRCLLARLVEERRVSEYVNALSERLRNVQVWWNDFEVVVRKAGSRREQNAVGILLDPPYPRHLRDFDYNTNSEDVWYRAARWAVANGDNAKYRIAVCGYSDAESDALFPPSWRRFIWRRAGLGQYKDKECIWFSPHCEGDEND